jgi:hypothetical protein
VIDNILYPVILLFLLFPLPYIFLKQGKNKTLFISSVVGLTVIVELLVVLIISPFIVLSIFIFPQLEAVGLTSYMDTFFVVESYLEKYYFVLTPSLHVLMTFFVFKRYKFFRESRGQPA